MADVESTSLDQSREPNVEWSKEARDPQAGRVETPGSHSEEERLHQPRESVQALWDSREVTSHAFNFTALAALYRDAIRNKESTLAFKVQNGVGQFLFAMFFSDDDKDSRDKLYVFLARTSNLLKFKVYGNHLKGDFKVYPSRMDEEAIREELDIHGGLHRFELRRFLSDLNSAFPAKLPLSSTIKTLREHRDLFHLGSLRSVVDDALKIYLIGPVRLPANKRPREKTLRKLYLYVHVDPNVIADFIADLKRKNTTVAWTDDPRSASNNTLRFLNSLKL